MIIFMMSVNAWSTTKVGNLWVRGYYNQTNASEPFLVAGNISTDGYFLGDGRYIENISAGSVGDIWVNVTGDTMSGNLDMANNSLTSVGGIVMTGLIQAYNITPVASDLFFGNITDPFGTIYVNNLYAKYINTSSLNATDIYAIDIFTTNVDANSISSNSLSSVTINSSNVSSDVVDTVNVTLGNWKVVKDDNGLTIIT